MKKHYILVLFFWIVSVLAVVFLIMEGLNLVFARIFNLTDITYSTCLIFAGALSFLGRRVLSIDVNPTGSWINKMIEHDYKKRGK